MLSRLVLLAVAIWASAGTVAIRGADNSGHELFKVDLGCASEATTFKGGWTRWRIDGGCGGDGLGTVFFENIENSGISVSLSSLGVIGRGDLCADAGEPIANTTFTRMRRHYPGAETFLSFDERMSEPLAGPTRARSEKFGLSLELTLSGYGLVKGEYVLKSYHNYSHLLK